MKQIKKVLNSGYVRIFKRTLKYIPGFRKGEKVNMIIASIYYILDIMLMIIAIIFLKDEDKINCLSTLGGVFLLPIFIFSFSDSINRK